MTTLKDQMADDMSVFYNTDEFAQDVTYTPKATGVPAEIRAIVDYGEIENRDGVKSDAFEHVLTCERDTRSGFGGDFSRRVATVWVKVADVAVPAVYDALEIDGQTYKVVDIYDHA